MVHQSWRGCFRRRQSRPAYGNQALQGTSQVQLYMTLPPRSCRCKPFSGLLGRYDCHAGYAALWHVSQTTNAVPRSIPKWSPWHSFIQMESMISKTRDIVVILFWRGNLYPSLLDAKCEYYVKLSWRRSISPDFPAFIWVLGTIDTRPWAMDSQI